MTKSGWYYERKELKQTPSILSGLPVEKEIEQRREGARFIMNVGNKMGLRYETMATGVVYFHRFYMVHTFQEFPRHVTACCCLFLAGKVEETPKKCRDIMKMAKANMDDVTWSEFGTDPREEVMTLERILLQTIKFDFIVEHPYSYLLKYAKGLKGDKKKLPNMVQMAWTFVNDSMCTTLCLQWEPEIIAIALMYLAGKLSKFEVTDWGGRIPKQEKWWDMYVSGITVELLEDICHQVLDLYSPNNRGEAGGPGGAGATAGLGGSSIASGLSSSKSSASSSALAVTAAASAVPPAVAISGSTSAASSNLIIADPPLAIPGSSQKRAITPTKAASQPPAKKAKKEEVKLSPAKPSPVKPESSTNPAQSYQYPYPSYSSYPPSYPPSQSSSSSSSSSTTPRYPAYSYPPTTTQGPPPPAQVAPQVPPPSYQPPQRHYPPPSTATPQAPPHYTSQPPPSHYPSSSHPPYHPPPTTSHYAAPPPTNYPPPSHGSSSSYYPPPAATTNPPPTYPQTATSSSYVPPSSYSHSQHSHSSSRSYYPPS